MASCRHFTKTAFENRGRLAYNSKPRKRCRPFSRGIQQLSGFSTSTVTAKEYDVTIVGGGAVGSVLAKQLSRDVPSLSISLVDARTPPSFDKVVGDSTTLPSPRAYALSPRSLNLLGDSVMEKLGNSGRIAPYDAMQVWESDGPAILNFTHDDLNEKASNATKNEVLGAVIEDLPMVASLWDELRSDGAVDLISPASIKKIVPPKNDEKLEITFERGSLSPESPSTTETIGTNLLIAADGGNSFVRRTLGIFPTVSFGYGRQAVTCTVAIDSSIQKIAFQRFQPNGPIALLPVWNKSSSGDKIYANIVWSTTPDEAKELMALSEGEFVERINDLLQSGPTASPPLISNEFKDAMPKPISDALNGVDMVSQTISSSLTMSGMAERQRGFAVPPLVTEIVGRTFAFDLNLMHARNYVGPRVALIGDAAHTIHPMAGQGLNLGMGDVECIVKNLKQAVESGMGVGGTAGLEYALQQYESERQREVVATIGGIQFLHGVFGTTFSPAVHARSVGMNIINSAGPIRRKLVQVACGLQGIGN